MADLRDISHGYALPDGNNKIVLRNISLALARGGFHVILGRSGCGKSTLLRLLSGIEQPQQGAIDLKNQTVGVVFQEPRLMPWLTVEDNIGFLIRGRLPADQRVARVSNMLNTVGLSHVGKAWPGQLSGGMSQRVAIARALVSKPDLLLMDEPFGALDAFTRKQMQDELIQLWQRTGTTIVFVTHDIEEAVRLGQTILVLEEGRFALTFKLDASYPRDGAEPAVNAARQKLLDQLFAPAPIPAQHGTDKG